MRMVRRNDDDKIDAPVRRKPCLPFGHFFVSPVDARGVEKQALPRRTAIGRVTRKHAGDEVDLLIQRGGDAVNASDKGALTAADHPHSEFASHGHLMESVPQEPNRKGGESQSGRGLERT